ncbi:brefeldin A-inhibited guanine nucleotide-exchange protein 1 [Cucurbita maxima]|uniref:Brefeldin A-inhibited guanine nucleotide-exchange protein 1 n=1 Tax=Cucurbita maxima TaxID=3661 RepID=A0A6J1I124_CUCMA|nr:brefeldin A-inhibited guanine nucleotide-exchange protein 1 [Cucurbita maxima]
MSISQTLGGTSRCGRAIGPSLDKIVKNAAWRKHSHLVSSCKSVLDKLDSIKEAALDPASPIAGLSPADAEFVLQPLLLALDAAYVKVSEPTLECVFKLFSRGIFCGEIERPDGEANSGAKSIMYKIIESVCKSGGLGDEGIELTVLRVLLSAVRCPCVLIRRDCLVTVVRNCYNVYLGGLSVTNQICAKSVLAQIMVIVFSRAEENSMDAPLRIITVSELLEFTDKNLNEGNSLYFCQNFINEIMDASEGIADLKLYSFSAQLQNGHASPLKGDNKGDSDVGEVEDGAESGGCSKIRLDGFHLFKNLCKLSMKFSSPEHPDDQILLRGKILSLELLKVVMGNAGPVWRSNERFLNSIKQFLCLSLLKNSALSVMAIFQLQCSIFTSLLTKFRSGLKAEIGIFFSMLVLRVLENVLQPSFLQKMTALNLLDKISQDSQIMVDIFVNYDCDVDSPNIFERMVNGLLKTALGPPSGSTTTLSPAQDVSFRLESVKCLVSIIKSMGTWMDQKLKLDDTYFLKTSENDASPENPLSGEETGAVDSELQSDGNSEFSDAATLEQRRAYKIELQKGISLFNRKPSRGIEFLISTKKVGGSPEEVASFLKNTNGLNETVIGDYLGEREEFPLKVMHAYVDSFNFNAMNFGEAIRFFLRGFRLPGEAQKIDRIMEKFAERYCKCNPGSFTSADTAYVLAYSVIMLNTDAHNNTVKEKMTKADFIRNNRGIDDGKDLPDEYLGTLYDQIVRNEIKMNSDSSASQSKQATSINKLLGFDGILNLVSWKQTEEKAVGANGLLIKHIQEQFKAKSGKSESVYHAVTDITILRFMAEVCWGPMLAAFSVTLDQSDDNVATSQCLLGFRHAVHVTAVMGLQTQRDAFVTSMAKFTYLHCAADMKQKNVEAVKAIISIAIEDGDFLQEAWEHIFTCLSRIENLQLLGEGAPPDVSFLTTSNIEAEEKALKSMGLSTLKKKGLQNPAVMAVVRGGSYDSTSLRANSPGPVTPEQINHLISNLNLLDQIGNFELNHVFAHSQSLNGEAIVAFVKALCKVAIAELQAPTDPRVFSLTKLVEVAHYNMNRIRLVWSRMWNVLSDFFVSVGLSENLSVAIFVMDSLRQLAMKFLEREELANYNFQNEFLRPFVIVMQKSNSTEIRELIVRCISQMVLSRVNNVKSGWKSVFMVFTAAAADERKNIVLLAFETMEKIVREYFPYITETETTTFTDCVRCLITFTNSRFNSDVSLNAIAFLRFCAVKLAEGGLVCYEMVGENGSSKSLDAPTPTPTPPDKDDYASYWVPLLAGLSKLTSDPRSPIRKSSLEVLFDILKDHGHLFSRQFWVGVTNTVVFPIFNSLHEKKEVDMNELDEHSEGSTWDSSTCQVAADCLVDLFISFFSVIRSQLPGVVRILTGLISNPIKGPASTGVAALLRLVGDLANRLTEKEWREIFLAMKEVATLPVPGFIKVLRTMDGVNVPGISRSSNDVDVASDQGLSTDGLDDDDLQTATYIVSRMKSHISMQLLFLQVVTDLYKNHTQPFSSDNISIILDIFSSISTHAQKLNSDTILQKKLQKVCSILDISDPPVVHFENESYQSHLNFLQSMLAKNRLLTDSTLIESELITLCEEILHIYLKCTEMPGVTKETNPAVPHWILPLGPARKEELAARTSLVASALRVLSGFERDLFKRYAPQLFPLLVELIRSEHSSGEVQVVLSSIFQSCIGPIIMQ